MGRHWGPWRLQGARAMYPDSALLFLTSRSLAECRTHKHISPRGLCTCCLLFLEHSSPGIYVDLPLLPSSLSLEGTSSREASPITPATQASPLPRHPPGLTLLCFFLFLAAPYSMWDPSSPTRGQTLAPCSGSAES